MDSATGVLPAPPTERLPTQITGIGERCRAGLAARARAPAAQSQPSGASIAEAAPCLYQNAGARIAFSLNWQPGLDTLDDRRQNPILRRGEVSRPVPFRPD